MESISKTLVYFYPNRTKSAKRHIFSKIYFQKKEFLPEEEGDFKLICCEIPCLYHGKKKWDKEQLRNVLEQELRGAEGDEWYIHPYLCSLLGFPPRIPEAFLLKNIFKMNSCWENVVLIGCDSREDGLGEDGLFERMSRIEKEQELLLSLLREYLPRINKLTVITNQADAYEELTLGFYEEYGLPAAFLRHLGESLKATDKTVILDFRPGYRPGCEAIPKKAVYIDIWSEEEKEVLISAKRADVSYLSVVNYLDTLLKNRYNTLVH